MRLLSTSHNLFTCFFFSLLFIISGAKIESKADAPSRFPALMVFGDSIVDPGNNNCLSTLAKCNFPPYGINFTGHKPTGRFSNGKIPGDLIASKLGIKEYLPAYIDVELAPEDLITGVSLASGGAGFDPLTSKAASVISMGEQLELFKEYVGKVMAVVGSERGSAVVSDSLYVICAGGDDVSNTYFPTPFRKTVYDMPSYASLVVGYASNFVQELVNLGAKNVVFISIPPVGCVPSQRTLGGGLSRDCASAQNQLAKLVNSRLSVALNRLELQFPGTDLVLADVYDFIVDMIEHPTKYGFTVSNRGCCGTGKIEVSTSCNSLTSDLCDDISKYLFWDSYHPTEKAYRILVDFIYEKFLSPLM